MPSIYNWVFCLDTLRKWGKSSRVAEERGLTKLEMEVLPQETGMIDWHLADANTSMLSITHNYTLVKPCKINQLSVQYSK